jgi:hypothetical protein
MIVAGFIVVAGFAARSFSARTSSGWVPSAADHEADRRELLRHYEETRSAHFRHDAAAFLASNDARWYEVSNGTVQSRTKAEALPELQDYLDSVKFEEIADVNPPHIEIADDGSMAWVLGHVRVRGTERQQNGSERPLAFESAWVDVWQKKAGAWRIVVHANTEHDDTAQQISSH